MLLILNDKKIINIKKVHDYIVQKGIKFCFSSVSNYLY